MSKEKLVIIEDDSAIRRVLELLLKGAGYESVLSSGRGDEGLELVKREKPNLVLLDLMLPGLGGIEICRRLKSAVETVRIPIIMLTAKTEEEDIIQGLDAGADDYVTKPFSKEVLLARIRAVLRRPENDHSKPYEFDGLVLTDATHSVELNGEQEELTLSEYRILFLFMSHRLRVYTRSQIIDEISEENKIVTDRTVDVQIVGLRKKLGPWAHHIETIRGIGYRLA